LGVVVSIEVLKLNRTVGLPLGMVEPLLWLAATSGGLWALVALDARRKLSVPSAAVDPTTSSLALAVAVVLLLNSLAALLYARSGGPVARGLSTASGAGLMVSGWLFTRMPEIGSGLSGNLFWGSVAAGVLLMIGSATPWRQVQLTGRRSTSVLLVVGVLGLAAVAGLVIVFGTASAGLVGTSSEAGPPPWDRLVPSWLVVTGLLGSVSQAWGRRYLAAAATVAVAVTASVVVTSSGA
jgi:hypothetical protein